MFLVLFGFGNMSYVCCSPGTSWWLPGWWWDWGHEWLLIPLGGTEVRKMGRQKISPHNLASSKRNSVVKISFESQWYYEKKPYLDRTPCIQVYDLGKLCLTLYWCYLLWHYMSDVWLIWWPNVRLALLNWFSIIK